MTCYKSQCLHLHNLNGSDVPYDTPNVPQRLNRQNYSRASEGPTYLESTTSVLEQANRPIDVFWVYQETGQNTRSNRFTIIVMFVRANSVFSAHTGNKLLLILQGFVAPILVRVYVSFTVNINFGPCTMKTLKCSSMNHTSPLQSAVDFSRLLFVLAFNYKNRILKSQNIRHVTTYGKSHPPQVWSDR